MHLGEHATGPLANLFNQGLRRGRIRDNGRVDKALNNGVLEVMHGVSNIVGEIHNLGLDTLCSIRRILAHPIKDLKIVAIDTELDLVAVFACLVELPGVLSGGVQKCPSQV